MGNRCCRRGLHTSGPQAGCTSGCWQPDAGRRAGVTREHSEPRCPPRLSWFLTCFQWPGGSALCACPGPHLDRTSQLLAFPLTLFVLTSILLGWGGQMLTAPSGLFTTDTGAQGNSNEEISCQWAGPGQGSQTAEWCDFYNSSPRQSKTQKPCCAVDGHLVSLVPSVTGDLGSAVSADAFTPAWKQTGLLLETTMRGDPSRLLARDPTQSRYERGNGISSHHSQDTRDKPSWSQDTNVKRASRHIIVKIQGTILVGPPSPFLPPPIHPPPSGKAISLQIKFFCASPHLDLQWFPSASHASLILHSISPMTCHKNGLFLTEAVPKVGFKLPCVGWGVLRPFQRICEAVPHPMTSSATGPSYVFQSKWFTVTCWLRFKELSCS